MPRRNRRAGQPNRDAQKTRRAIRVETNVAFRQFRTPYPEVTNDILRDRQPQIFADERRSA